MKDKKLAAQPKRLAIVYLAVWLFSVLMFWIFKSGPAAMLYTVVFLWVLIPATSFIISMLVGRTSCCICFKWCIPVILGVLLALCDYVTFKVANTLSSGNINSPEIGLFLYGAIVSMVGLIFGIGLNFLQAMKK